MATTTQTVLIDFVSETEGLESALATLEKTGAIDAKMVASFKQTTAEINKQAQAIKAVSDQTKTLKPSLESIAAATKKTSQEFIAGFQEGMLDALKEAGVSLDEFLDKLTEAGAVPPLPDPVPDTMPEKVKTVKKELRELTEQIARAKAEGNDYGEQYDLLVQKAGDLKDAIADVNQEIRQTGSDTKTIDGAISAVQGLAGGFAVVQGTQALFGAESEELQQTLLKVNAAMAVLQGLQSIQNVLQKESAASLLLLNIQQKVNNANLVLENALQSRSIIVRTGAAIAQRVLNAAMAANPIGIVVVALAGLVTLLNSYASSAAKAARETSNLNVALGAGEEAFNARLNAIKLTSENTIKALENEGQAASRITQQEIENLKTEMQVRQERRDQLQRDLQQNTEADLEQRQQTQRRILELDDQLLADRIAINNKEFELRKTQNAESLKARVATIEAELAVAAEGSERQLQLQRQLISARAALEQNADGLLAAERLAISRRAYEEQLALQAEFDRRRIETTIRGIETQLVNVEEGSREELQLRQRLIGEQARAELTSTKLSEDEKKAIKERALAEQLKLQRDYNKRITAEAIADEISRNNAAIARLKITDEDKLLLTLANIELAAEAEVQAADGNGAKIKEIYARRDADILATKKRFIEEALEYEIALASANNGAERRQLERTRSNERNKLSIRIAAMRELTDIEVAEIDRRLDALFDMQEQGLISEKDFNLKYAQLLDERKAKTEKTEEDIRNLRTQSTVQTMQVILEVANQIGEVISTVNDITTANENNRLQGMRNALQEAQEAGAISEKEAIARQKRIDAEEKKLRMQQAQREKAMATFNAFLRVPQAALQGLITGGPILAAIYGGLALVQAILVASRPLPKFGTGKKNRYQGWAEIAETGPELVERNGRLYLEQKPTITWLAATDKVFSPQETRKMLEHPKHHVDRAAMNYNPNSTSEYRRLTREMTNEIRQLRRNMKNVVVNVGANGVTVDEGMSRINYMNQRYSYRSNA